MNGQWILDSNLKMARFWIQGFKSLFWDSFFKHTGILDSNFKGIQDSDMSVQGPYDSHWICFFNVGHSHMSVYLCLESPIFAKKKVDRGGPGDNHFAPCSKMVVGHAENDVLIQSI